MLKYFIYCRKSTDDKTHQILSIDAQRTELQNLAAANGLHVAQIFEESMSAKAPGRPILNDMLRRIEKGEANAILTWKLDRLARNFEDGGRIIGLLHRAAIQEIRTFDKTYFPSDNVLMIAVELGMANQYVRDLSVNIKRGYREKVRRGVYPAKAPLGYMNHPRLRTIEPDPMTFRKVKRVLELFAAGKHSLTAIQREMTKAGLVGNRSGKPLPLSSIHKLLANPFFYGVFQFKGELHQGIHAPMISKATFDAIQKARIDLAKPRHKRGCKGLIFLNFATCGSCGYCISGERHTKPSGLRFLYYRCTHKGKRERCQSRTYVRAETMASEVKRNAELVTISTEWKERFFARIETWENEGASTADGFLVTEKAKFEALNERINRLNAAFADGGLEMQEFREMKNPLIAERVEMAAKIASLMKKRATRLEPLRNWISEANTVESSVSEENWPEMKKTLQTVGSNRFLHDQTLTVSFIKPWDSLAKANLAVQSTTDPAERCEKWWR